MEKNNLLKTSFMLIDGKTKEARSVLKCTVTIHICDNYSITIKLTQEFEPTALTTASLAKPAFP